MMTDAKIRLFVDHSLALGQSLDVNEDQARYLFSVMRLNVGAGVLVFNGRDGEWLATVEKAGKRGGVLCCVRQTLPLMMPPDLWLVFAPIKKARTDFIVEKAVELGVARIMPMQTQFTNTERIRGDRLQAHAREAAEQCGATYVPMVDELQGFDRLLAGWPQDRHILWCDEEAAGQGGRSISSLPAHIKQAPWAIFIGPEGGFSDREREKMARLPYVTGISLGPRILRADTAAVAALALWQNFAGDWV